MTPLSVAVVTHRLRLNTINLNLKSVHSPTMKIQKAMQNVEIVVVLGDYGSPNVMAASPFDREHKISYSTLIDTGHLSCTIFQL